MNNTWLDLVDVHCLDRPQKIALTYLKDGDEASECLTFLELRTFAVILAQRFQSAGLYPGDRVVISLISGPHFLIAFIACLYAGLIPVPVKTFGNRASLQKLVSVVKDAQPKALLSERCLEDALTVGEGQQDKRWLVELSRLLWLPKPDFSELHLAASTLGRLDRLHAAQSGDIAFLQYTSGSTADPKGVCVTHRNLVHNITVLQCAWQVTSDDVYLTWLPLYHDMGLIGAALLTLGSGAHCVMMPPTAFAMKPLRWLRNIDKYRATITGGPNFAYRALSEPRVVKMAGDLDLSSLRVMYCGSEPIVADTVRAFQRSYVDNKLSPNVFFPCYGMAEATLMLSGGPVGREPIYASDNSGRPMNTENSEVISCGRIMCEEMLVVDPASCLPVSPGAQGEIWVRGDSIAVGYWNNPRATRDTFQAKLASSSEHYYLKTGDLGFVRDGEVYINGRLKEVIIVNGNNLYPQDIEASSMVAFDSAAGSRAACFSLIGGQAEEVVLFQEVGRLEGRGLSSSSANELINKIKYNVYHQFSIPLKEVVLVKRNSIPRTTSGKIARLACRDLYIKDKHQVLKVPRREEMIEGQNC